MEKLGSNYKSYFKGFNFQGCNNVYLSRDLMNNLKVKTSGKIIFRPIKDEDNKFIECTGIEICPCNSTVTTDTFKNYVLQNSRYNKMLLNSGVNITFEDGSSCLIKLLPDECNYDFFDNESLNKIDVRIVEAASIENYINVRPLDNEMIQNDVNLKITAQT